MCRFNFVWIKKAFIIAFLLLQCSTMVYSQQTETGKPASYNWEVGFNLGMLSYLGDVSQPKDPSSLLTNSTDFGYGLSLAKQITPLFGVKGNLVLGKLKGKANSSNFTFNSDLVEAMINASVNFSELCWGANRKQLVNVYGLVGLGVGNFNGSTVNKSTGAIIRSFGHHEGGGINGYEIDGIGNLGLSVAIKLGSNVNATIESAFKFTSDDKLDGVSGGFKQDVYNYTSFGIAYKLPLSKNHKGVRNDNILLPSLIKSNEPEAKVIQNVPAQETKKIDSIIKPVEQKVEIKNEVENQSPDLVDSLANKIEKMMAKKKDEPSADRVKTDDNAAESKNVKPVTSSGNMDSYTGYKVQLFATQKSMDAKVIKQKYPFATNIRVDKIYKLYHCSIGSFATFKEANKFSNNLHKKKGLQKAFVVYFKNGKRVGSVKK